MSYRDMVMETATRALTELDAEGQEQVLRSVFGEVPTSVLCAAATARAARLGHCCDLFNGYHQQCKSTRYNAGHSHPCTGCHDCCPGRFPLDNHDVQRLLLWYREGHAYGDWR